MKTENSVVVLGGGVSGLISAYELAKSGYDVTILEKKSLVGGRLYPFRKNGFAADAGAQLIGEEYHHTFKLLDELGLMGDLIKLKEPSAAVYSGNRIFQLDTSGLIRYNKLNFREKINLFRLLKKVRGIGVKKHLGFTNTEDESYFGSMSIAEWTVENFSEDLLEYFVQPSLTALTLADPEKLSAFYGLTLFYSDLKSSYTLKNGLSSFVSVLIQRLEEQGVVVKTGCEVREIIVEDNEVCGVEYETSDGTKVIETSNVVCSVPAPVIKDILPSLPPKMKSLLSKIDYSSGLQILIALDQRVWDRTWAILVPRSEFKDIAMISESTLKCSNFAPAGKGLMEVYIYGETAKKLSKQSNKVISDFAVNVLENLFPEIGKKVLWCEALRWTRVIPIHPPGFFTEWKEFVSTTKGLFFAGDYLYQPSLESAVCSGVEASRAIVGTGKST